MADTRHLAVRRLAATLLGGALLSLTSCGVVDTLSAGMPGAEPADGSTAAAGAAPVDPGERVPARTFRRMIERGMEASTTARLTLNVTAGGQRVRARGAVDYTQKPPSSVMRMSVQGHRIELRTIGGLLYMRLPTTRGKFVALDPQAPGNSLGPGIGAQVDPEQQLDALQRGVRRVVYVGEQAVEGGSRHRYRLVVDTARMAGVAGFGADAAALPKTLTYDLLLDDQHRTRKIAMDFGKKLPGSFEMRVDDYGAKVAIRKPPPGQVVQKPRTTV